METSAPIRRATTDDIPLIREMALVVFPDTYKDILSPEQLEYMLDWMYSEESLRDQMERRSHCFLLAEGRGYASFWRDGATEDGRDRFHLEKIYVMPSEQGSGFGRKLFETVLSSIREMSAGHPRVELNVNRGNKAVGFYGHMGMRVLRSGDFPIGRGFYMNDYIMGIDL